MIRLVGIITRISLFALTAIEGTNLDLHYANGTDDNEYEQDDEDEDGNVIEEERIDSMK